LHVVLRMIATGWQDPSRTARSLGECPRLEIVRLRSTGEHVSLGSRSDRATVTLVQGVAKGMGALLLHIHVKAAKTTHKHLTYCTPRPAFPLIRRGPGSFAF
jgi:hypothetical protein